MGQIFSQLTQPNSALINSNGSVAAMGDPSKMRDIDFGMHSQLHPTLPGGQNPNPPMPSAQTPTFQQAASYGATPGGGNALSPGLTKAGKLATILQSGLQGALAGRAKSEETVAATGGRRAGGAGMGFEAGYTLPWQRAAQQNQLAQQQAQTGVLQSEAQNVNIPGVGQIPGWLAKTLGPAGIKAQSAQTVQGMKGDTAEDIQQQKGATQEKIHRFIPTAVGLFDTQTRQTIPETQNGIMITPDIAKDNDLPQEYIGKPMKLGELAQVRRADVFQNSPMMTAQGPIVVNRKTATGTPVQGTGGQQFSPPALASPREVADVDNPGQTIITSGAGAMGRPGVNSASVQVPKKAAAAEVPTAIGDKRVAFDTAIQHADLLRQAAKALNNGDVRALSGLSNRAQTQFGDPDLTNFEAISNAYNHEVTSVISKGHITDNEVGTGNRTLPSSANYETINKVLDSYQNLMKSKMNMLDKQKASAVNASQPNKPNAKKNDPMSIRP